MILCARHTAVAWCRLRTGHTSAAGGRLGPGRVPWAARILILRRRTAVHCILLLSGPYRNHLYTFRIDNPGIAQNIVQRPFFTVNSGNNITDIHNYTAEKLSDRFPVHHVKQPELFSILCFCRHNPEIKQPFSGRCSCTICTDNIIGRAKKI